MRRIWEVHYDHQLVYTGRSYKACRNYLYEPQLEDPACDPYGDDFGEHYIAGIAFDPEHDLTIIKTDRRDSVTMSYSTANVAFKIIYFKGNYKFKLALKDRYTVKSIKCHETGGWYQYATRKYLFEVAEVIQEDLDLPYEIRNIIEKDFKKFLTKDIGHWFRH